MGGAFVTALKEFIRILKANRSGEFVGIYSICTSHELALQAAMRQAILDKSIVLIESTANQVNQFGGYTGMKPADFPEYVYSIADKVGLERNRILLGGDHLGPLCWTKEDAPTAMLKARQLVADYVSAGYQKIHLDASMGCRDDIEPLAETIVAERAAQLCAAAEAAAAKNNLEYRPVYVIGTEVPEPGGATESMEGLAVTPVQHVERTYKEHRDAFVAAGLNDAWERVVGLVVQPGVEFNHTDVRAYQSDEAQELSNKILELPSVVYEAHSTDYQPSHLYAELVRDHFAILKVGPQLTFALREALFALAAIENEVVAETEASNLLGVAEQVMLAEPDNWEQHYPKQEPAGRLYRRFSYSDRIRYYWTHPQLKKSVETLFSNLAPVKISKPLLSQYLPLAMSAAETSGCIQTPEELVVQHVMAVTGTYSEACGNHG